MRKKIYIPKKLKPELERPFEEKVENSLKLIKVQLEKHRYGSFVACSFGKDSVTVLNMIREFKPDIPVLFANTLVEHPDTYKFRDFLVKEWNLNLIETKPIKTFWEVADEKGLDDGRKHTNSCCYYLKERPAYLAIKKYGFTTQFDGIMLSESRHRMFTICRLGLVQVFKKWGIIKVHPIAYWTEEDVWKYIKENNLPYNPIYDKGFDRSGCIVCTSWKYWREQMAKHYPGIYKRIQEKYFGQKILTNEFK